MSVKNWLHTLLNSGQQQGEQESSLAEEAGLPDSWRPIDSAPINPSSFAGRPNPMANFFSGPISPTLQHDKVFVDTQLGTPAIAKLPLVPLSASGQPSVGSAVQSGSTTTINNNVTAVAGGPNGAVQYNNGGALAGSPNFNWSNSTSSLSIVGSLSVTTPIAIISGGTGTSTPGLVAGQDITITGSWPNNTLSVSIQAGVVAGSYTNTNLTVDSSGIITAIANGVSGPVITSVNLLTQTANVAATNLLASASAGTYLVTVYLIVSQAASSSSTLPDSRIIYTDNQSGATITVPLTSGLTTNTTSTFAQATFIVNAKATTAINFDVGQITPYASSGGTVMQFSYHARAVFLN